MSIELELTKRKGGYGVYLNEMADLYYYITESACSLVGDGIYNYNGKTFDIYLIVITLKNGGLI